jgi:hypothetical protein
MRRVIAAGVLVAAMAGGCSSGSHHVTSPSTTAAVNPDVVPAVITPAYVDSVFVVLNHVAGNATRALVSSHTVSPQVVMDLRSIFNDPLFKDQLTSARSALTTGGLSNVMQDPGDSVTTVNELVSASPTCLFVEVSSDFSAVDISPPRIPAVDYLELQQKQARDDPGHLNRTPWAISSERVSATPTAVSSPCGH